MKKVVVLCTLFVFLFTVCASRHYFPPGDNDERAEYDRGYMEGEQYAKSYGSGYIWGSLAASLLFSPLIGGGIVTAIAYGDRGHPPFPPEGSQAYKKGFLDGYGDARCRKNGGAALLGAGIGVGINAVVLTVLLLTYNP